MRRPSTSAIVCTLLFATGCRTSAREMTAGEQASVSAAVEARVSGYIDAVRRRDIDSMLDFWADTEGFVMAGDGQLTEGYDTWAQVLRDNMVTRPTVNSFAKRNAHIFVLAPDAASYSMEFEWSMNKATGDTLRARGAWTYVFKRLNGKWQVVQSGGTHVYF